MCKATSAERECSRLNDSVNYTVSSLPYQITIATPNSIDDELIHLALTGNQKLQCFDTSDMTTAKTKQGEIKWNKI